MYRPRKIRRIAPYRHTGRRPVGASLLPVLFFPAAILYHELLLRAFDDDTSFFGPALLRILLFSVAAGLCFFLILDLLPRRKAARITGGVFLVLNTVLFCVERGCRATFGIYYGITFVGGMAGAVAGGFGSIVLLAIMGLIPFILLSLVPLAAYILLRESIVREEGQEPLARILLAAGLVLFQLAGYLLSVFGPVKNYYTYEFTASTAIPHFGLFTATRLDLEYAVFGTPKPSLSDFLDPMDSDPPSAGPSAAVSAPPSADPTQPPKEYGFNQLDIDFEALAEGESDKTIKEMHQFFGMVTPTQQNEYTGMFKGKNLILLTAEGFCPYAVDKDLTPTLYRLTREGVVCGNFYQPDWTQSTCGGEFAVTTGLIPNWISGKLAAKASVDVSMPVTLARLFAAQGYSVPAWHNHTYTYYGRNEYLGNFGYDYKGIEGGLELAHDVWPNSDLEMMEATADSYIDGYVNNGERFHAYYMTVSGHGYYSWGGNAMSRKHRAEVETKYPDLSETSQAYLACNMELDLALEYLVDKLEAAGIADDTLIVMTGDHYPYLMVDDKEDYYNELRGFEDTESDTSRYRNTLLMWSGAFDTPVQVDIPCSSIDIVPTICNLFGLEYDSRLYSGRDIFATNYQADKYSNSMPLVVFANNKGEGNSWITAAGTYEASTRTFTPNEGITVDDEYVTRVHRLVAAKVNYAKLILQEDYYSYVFPD